MKKRYKKLQKTTKNNWSKTIDKLIKYSFLVLFFFTPLLVSFQSFELFEFPKMLFVYFITTIIGILWFSLMIINNKIIFKRSYLDIPLLLFLLTQLISSINSIQPHTSWVGYYSRFHGGMYSTIAYSLLTWAFITFADKIFIKKMLYITFASISMVGTYAIAEHFGIDSSYWVQDVQNRVFSTLGQPNWLAAWLGSIIPFILIFILQHNNKKDNFLNKFWIFISFVNFCSIFIAYSIMLILTHNPLPVYGNNLLIFLSFLITINFIGVQIYKSGKSFIKINFNTLNLLSLTILLLISTSAILYSKSRSGILALFISILIFWVSYLINDSNNIKKLKQKITQPIFIGINILFIILILIIGTEFTPNLIKKNNTNLVANIRNTPTPIHTDKLISKSTDIRNIVWRGAIKTWKQYPLLGSGTSTFAYSYYQNRPREHNDLSEWDFLYNKAHNEYLDFLANNGLIGLASVFWLIIATIWILIKNHWKIWLSLISIIITISLGLFILFPKLLQYLINNLIIYPPLLKPLGLAMSIAIGLTIITEIIGNKFNTLTLNIKLIDNYSPAVLGSIFSIFVTNFYGFSVVNVAIVFFMNLAITAVIYNSNKNQNNYLNKDISKLSLWQYVGLTLILVMGFLIIIKIFDLYQADKNYNIARNYTQRNALIEAEEYINKAIIKNPNQAEYYQQKATILANTALILSTDEATSSMQLANQIAQKADQYALKTLSLNPVHLNFYKQLTRVYIIISAINSQYTQKAINTLLAGSLLAPTDPQLTFNIANIYQQLGDFNKSEQYYLKTVKLKPNYRKAWIELGSSYQMQQKYQKAKEVYNFILENIDPKDQTSLKEIKNIEGLN